MPLLKDRILQAMLLSPLLRRPPRPRPGGLSSRVILWRHAKLWGSGPPSRTIDIGPLVGVIKMICREPTHACLDPKASAQQDLRKHTQRCANTYCTLTISKLRGSGATTGGSWIWNQNRMSSLNNMSCKGSQGRACSRKSRQV